MNLQDPKHIQTFYRIVVAILLYAITLALFVPMNPVQPAAGLDGSWMMGINQAVARGMVFGRDMVFTFGPYGSIDTELYDPATARLMFWGSLFLGLNYATLLLLLGKGEALRKLLLYAVFLACFLDSRDALLFTYPLILALVIYRLTLPDDHAWKLQLGGKFEYGLALLFAPLGLLPLVKGSLLPLCAITLAMCVAILLRRRNFVLGSLAAGASVISTVFFWYLSGQPIAALPYFLISSRKFISGYADAMSFRGNSWECILYVLASAFMIQVFVWKSRGPRSSTWFLCSAFAIFLFVAFKAGFVRQDLWHNIIPGSSILAAALLLTFVLNYKSSLPLLAAALLIWAYIGHGINKRTAVQDISKNFWETFGSAIQEATSGWPDGTSLQNRYAAQIAGIRTTNPIPTLPGTMDIYSYNQSTVLASGNIWSPRPVMQSYAAYSAELAELNLRHLLGSDAPDNVLFRVEPIDGRLASLEDGLSWPVLVNRYSFQKLEGGTAYLQKKTETEQHFAERREEIYSGRQKLGEEVMLPDSSDPLFAQMEINLTFLGKIRSALFKSPELHIAMRLRNGNEANFRLISTMTQSDFLITPLVENTEDFVKFAAGGAGYLSGKEVKSLVISADDPHGLFWNRNYSLKLSQLSLLKNQGAENSLRSEKLASAASRNPAISAAR